MIPCTSKCVYQSDGLCTLDSAAAAGQPALGGACVHFIPQDAARLDRLTDIPGRDGTSGFGRRLYGTTADEPAPRTSGIPGAEFQTPADLN